MLPIKNALLSSLGKKYVMAITGLALVGFIVTHLAANLLLYSPDPEPFNAYTKGLHDWGSLLYVAEIGLGVLFLVHAAMAIYIHFVDKPKATGKRYLHGQRSKGGPSKFGLAGSNMIITGVVLLAFLVLHVIQFRFGPGIAEGYVTTIDGQQARDLHRLVVEILSQPVWAAIYVGVMLFLFLHLRHGFWSAFQSLGAMKPEWSKGIYAIALLIALLLAAGFLFIPIWLMFDMPGRLQ